LGPCAPAPLEALGPSGRKRRAEARTQALAPMIWRLRALGMSTREIAGELNRQAVQPPRKCWHGSAVAKMLAQTAAEFGGVAAMQPPPFARSQIVRRRARAAVIAPLMWDLLAEGKSKLEVAAELNRRGVPSPRNRRWHIGSVQTNLDLAADRLSSHPEAARALEVGSKRLRLLRKAGALAPIIAPLRQSGMPFAAIAEELERRGFSTTKNRKWSPSMVWKLFHLASDATGGGEAAL